MRCLASTCETIARSIQIYNYLTVVRNMGVNLTRILGRSSHLNNFEMRYCYQCTFFLWRGGAYGAAYPLPAPTSRFIVKANYFFDWRDSELPQNTIEDIFQKGAKLV